ncbi:maleylpyruvate isomerase family mycothiol-dependent enzyme [Streptomyces sp. SDr-06]|uniref:maleylpyruvate isomerase family mycothiol-dependent enzyme n=1 Tax=Streptomyces sp. SDr-06 TaxID=2267702 RepID=UPI000DEB3CED|nr:maleylpyruvate isomerase family mycothiol-dependent enzyme [Streptomyces sp. SDr-06]RCH64248.1 maleylpyruvate isomerase family mycothiol-dependent enzyme [Streptomyces sp. SDr-06]
MQKNLELPDLLRLIDERATAFRAAIAAAPSLDVQVPTCPEWTLFDLARHVGSGRPFWSAVVAAGPADAPPAEAVAARAAAQAPRERAALVDWLAASTQELLDTLREAGPDAGCWTWWGASQSPRTSGAVARHQLQEIAMHTYDAQLTVGAAQPLPAEVALDGVEDFLFTCCAWSGSWPHEPAVVDYHATEGRSWRFTVEADGARAVRLPAAGEGEAQAPADASARGTAGELVLWFYGRTSLDSVKIDGDQGIFERLFAWDPTA